jgi:hypothetical protein
LKGHGIRDSGGAGRVWVTVTIDGGMKIARVGDNRLGVDKREKGRGRAKRETITRHDFTPFWEDPSNRASCRKSGPKGEMGPITKNVGVYSTWAAGRLTTVLTCAPPENLSQFEHCNSAWFFFFLSLVGPNVRMGLHDEVWGKRVGASAGRWCEGAPRIWENETCVLERNSW